MSRYYDLSNANPPTYDSSPAAIQRFWSDFHSASPTEKANFIRRHPNCQIPEPIDPDAFVDSSLMTFEKADNRYRDSQPDLSAEIAARATAQKIKLDAAAAELQRRVAAAQAVLDANQVYARELHWRYNKRVADGPPPEHSRADTAAELKLQYVAVRGLDKNCTYEYVDHQHVFRLNGCSDAAFAQATRELAQASNEIT